MREGCHRVCFLPLRRCKSFPGMSVRVLVLIGSYLLLVFVLPVALSAVVSYRALPVGRACPHCSGETLLLRVRLLRLLSALHPRASLHRRWCLACGWEGMARVPVVQPFVPVRTEPKAATRPTQTLDVRSLDVDGTPWRV